MIVIPLLALLSDITVAGLVTTVALPGRCQFGAGVVIPGKPVDWRSVPGNQQRAFWMVSSAHETSRKNGGKTGIYWKANGDANFRADSRDIVGGWSCYHEANRTVRYAKDTDSRQISNDLISRGLLYNSSTGCSNSYPDRAKSDLLFLSASIADTVPSPWDVRVSLDFVSKGPHQPIEMENFRCEMNAKPVEWILSKINSLTTLDKWCLGIYGSIENRSIDTTLLVLRDAFNTMVMVGWGGGINAYDIPSGQSSDPEYSTQGCLHQRAAVPWVVCTLFILDTTALLLIGAFWTVLQVRVVRQSRNLSSENKTFQNQVPGELLHWIQLLILEEERKQHPAHNQAGTGLPKTKYWRWTLGIQQDKDGIDKLGVKRA
jgi:hypothetical protein